MIGESLTEEARRALQFAYLDVLVACGALAESRVTPGTHARVREQLSVAVRSHRATLLKAGLGEDWLNCVQKPVVALIDESARRCTVSGFGADWKSLASDIYGHENLGDEAFQDLEALRRRSDVPWDVLDLFSRCLLLGLEGQYLKNNRGQALIDLRRALERDLAQRRPPQTPLAPQLTGTQLGEAGPVVISPPWIVTSAVGVLVLVMGSLMLWVITEARQVEGLILDVSRQVGQPITGGKP